MSDAKEKQLKAAYARLLTTAKKLLECDYLPFAAADDLQNAIDKIEAIKK